MNVLVIEDEPLLANKLVSYIEAAAGDWEVVGKCGSVQEALDWWENNTPPHLIFSDIRLPDGLSFDLYQRVEASVPIIFCTAYDDYALDAFQANGIDYILKPFGAEDIAKALDKFQQLTEAPAPPPSELLDQLKTLLGREQSAPSGMLKTLLVYQGEQIIPIKTAEVAFAELDQGRTFIRTYTGSRHLVGQGLDALHQQLGEGFFRANRQMIIHRNAVEAVEQYFARKLLIKPTIEVPEKVIVSKANASNFIRWLQEN